MLVIHAERFFGGPCGIALVICTDVTVRVTVARRVHGEPVDKAHGLVTAMDVQCCCRWIDALRKYVFVFLRVLVEGLS